MAANQHPADGSDERGRALVITIRIAPDGTLYFHDITPDLLPVASALAPRDPTLRTRAEIAAKYGQETAP
jgi:hypothetical protein